MGATVRCRVIDTCEATHATAVVVGASKSTSQTASIIPAVSICERWITAIRIGRTRIAKRQHRFTRRNVLQNGAARSCDGRCVHIRASRCGYGALIQQFPDAAGRQSKRVEPATFCIESQVATIRCPPFAHRACHLRGAGFVARLRLTKTDRISRP